MPKYTIRGDSLDKPLEFYLKLTSQGDMDVRVIDRQGLDWIIVTITKDGYFFRHTDLVDSLGFCLTAAHSIRERI